MNENVFIQYFLEYGSLFNPETMKFVFTFGYALVQSYMYCSLFQRVTDRVGIVF